MPPCPHGRRRYSCKDCGGKGICEQGRQRNTCRECGGSSICEHGQQRSQCKECGGSSICEHGRQRNYCKECGGKSICQHGRRRRQCKECGGSGLCEHGRQRSRCKQCGGGGKVIILEATAVEEFDEEEGASQSMSGSTTAQGHVSDVVKEEAHAALPKWPAGATLKIEESPPEMPAGAMWSNMEQATSGSEGPRSKKQRARRDSASRE